MCTLSIDKFYNLFEHTPNGEYKLIEGKILSSYEKIIFQKYCANLRNQALPSASTRMQKEEGSTASPMSAKTLPIIWTRIWCLDDGAR